MTLATNEKRLDIIESNLTPREWAIRFADELRRYPSREDFYKAMSGYADAKNTPSSKPYHALNNQAEKLHPGKRPEDARERYLAGRKLRGEYHALKALIIDTNEKLRHKAEIFKLNAKLLFWMLYALILLADSERTKEHAATTDAAEGDDDTRFLSMVESCVYGATYLVGDFCLYEAVYKIIREKYFDGHPFIYRDVEAMQEKTYKMIDENVALYTECFGECGGDEDGALTVDIDKIRAKFDKKAISAVAEKWVKDARDKATFEILDETDHARANAFLWGLAKEEAGKIETNGKT